LYGRIEFVGMSVYKPEATKGVPMEHIYIPLTTVAEQADDRNPATPRGNPTQLLQPGNRHVILGDPGSGKSTLLKFMALSGLSVSLQQRYQVQPDRRLPILVVLRRYADALKSDPDLALMDYILHNLRADLSIHADQQFLEFYLESGEALLLFDGMDELPDPRFKQTVRDRIHCLLNTYPANAAVITSRIVGYENPYRFDDKTYGHHKLARLSLEEMERFVSDWYTVRVENAVERQANVDDLVRILRDTQQQAIRELASNPLLLTIIALVHRIDAVLPDERVVLYQKCTETLLNTWYTWKFRGETQERRGKTERHNRSRIEALAHWMHLQAGGGDADQRAVIPHQQALEFLTVHIREHEPKVDPENAQDLAEDFLTFVKRRAGLLIEVGDHQYSFVHLTFQEYLTSTYLAAKTEMGGVQALWQEIAERVTDPRWHEIMRLLVAGLRSSDSQAFLCQQLLALPADKEACHLALLLGGLLLDGVEAAEQEGGDIVKRLFAACVSEQEPELLSRLVAVLRTLHERSPDEQDYLEAGYEEAWAKAPANDQIGLLLAGFAAGLSETRLAELTGNALALPRCDWLRWLLSEQPVVESSGVLSGQLSSFYNELAVYATTVRWSNRLAAVAEAVLAPNQSAYLAFRLRLFLILFSDLYTESYGPFNEFGCYPAEILASETINISLNWAQDRAHNRDRTRTRDRARDRAHNRAWNRDLDQTMNRDRTRTLARDLDEIVAKARFEQQTSETIWRLIAADTEFADDLTNLWLDGLQLEPRALWQEALHSCFLPSVPSRLWLYQPETWRRVEANFASSVVDENDSYAAAWLLLYDIWLFITGAYPTPDASPFNRLAELTRDHDAPALQVAHCLRDLTHGDETQAEKLNMMIADPRFHQLFHDAMWVD
jgi:energy-coupling factor transporter ATP-binding protein EcfA2